MGANHLRRMASQGRVCPDRSLTSRCPPGVSRPLAAPYGQRTLLMGWDRAGPQSSAVGRLPRGGVEWSLLVMGRGAITTKDVLPCLKAVSCE